MSALGMTLLALACAAAAALGAIALPQRTGRGFGFAGLAVAALVALFGAGRALAAASVERAGSWPLHTGVRLDPLAAFFIMLISLVALGVGIYGLGGRTADERGSGCTTAAVAGLIFLACLLICLADDALLFIFAWELLSVAFYWAAGFAGSDAGSQRAGYVTALVTHSAGAGLIAALLLMARGSDSFSLPALFTNVPTLAEPMAITVFLLLLVAFAAKLGTIPMQAWLPLGYSSAPSVVAALMAGGALNVGFYGIIRFIVEPPWQLPLWCGVLVLAAGAVSAFLGIAYALAQHDMRALAAYSSIENGGIIVAALGAALIAKHLDLPLLVGMAIAAAFLQITAHALAKALLFLSCSSIRDAAGTTSLQRLGGLARVLPSTSLAVGAAALSLAAIPPLAGFSGEWSVLETLMQAFRLSDVAAEVAFALAGATIGVAAGLAIVAFVKCLGIGILGAPRCDGAVRARESLGPRTVAMALVALVLIGVGVLSPQYLGWIGASADAIAGVPAVQAMIGSAPLLAPSFPGFSSISPLGLLGQFAGFGLAFAVLVALVPRPRPRRAEVWTSGNPYVTSANYTGTGFVNATRAIAAAVVATERTIEVEGSPLAPLRVRYESRTHAAFDLPLYRRVADGFLRVADLARATQSGKIGVYLSYILIFVIAVLVFYPSIRNW